jgi:hypothetical protein
VGGVAISISDRLRIHCFGIFAGCPTHALSQGLDELVELDYLRHVEARMVQKRIGQTGRLGGMGIGKIPTVLAAGMPTKTGVLTPRQAIFDAPSPIPPCSASHLRRFECNT